VWYEGSISRRREVLKLRRADNVFEQGGDGARRSERKRASW